MVEDRALGRLMTPDEVIAALKHEVSSGRNQIGSIASLLRQVLDDDHWHEYRSSATGMTIQHGSFREFVTKGLGIPRIEVLTGWVESRDKEVAERARQAWRGEVPAAAKHGANQWGDSGHSATGSTERADGILARLKRDHPDIAQQVIDGTITANAAARQLGWRKPRVLLTTPQQVATKLREHYNTQELQTIAELISE